MIYEKATAEVILFDNSDVITASGWTQGSHKNCKNSDSSTCPNGHQNQYVSQNRKDRFERTLG